MVDSLRLLLGIHRRKRYFKVWDEDGPFKFEISASASAYFSLGKRLLSVQLSSSLWIAGTDCSQEKIRKSRKGEWIRASYSPSSLVQ